MKNATLLVLFLSLGHLGLLAQAGQIYGLNFVNSSLQFARLDPTSGAVNILSNGPISPDQFSQGVADFDPITKSYFYIRGIANNAELIQVNAPSGQLIRRVTIDNPNGAVTPMTNLAYNWLEDKIYGVSHEFSGSDRLRLSTVDLATGDLTVISSQPSSVGPYQSGNSDIDPIHRKYYYATPNEIVTVDLDNGEATSVNLDYPDNSVNQFFVNLTYNWLDQKIYGLHFLAITDPNPFDTLYFTSQLRLATVDAGTGQVDIISELPTSPDGFSTGNCDIDPANNRYFYIRQQQLHVVDLTTGELLDLVPIENNNNAVAPIVNMVYDDQVQTQALRMNMPNELSLAPGETLELNAWVGDDAQYRWSDGATEAIRQIDVAGRYEVEITKGDITVVGETTVDFSTSLRPTSPEERSWQLFPQPASDVLNYQSKSTLQEAVSLEIMDLTGKRVRQTVLDRESGTIDLSDMVPGTYWLRLREADRVEVQPLIIQR
ncbi:MAG: T9SS type A sorting domain-containing protein [Bacteroidota bacterium]